VKITGEKAVTLQREAKELMDEGGLTRGGAFQLRKSPPKKKIVAAVSTCAKWNRKRRSREAVLRDKEGRERKEKDTISNESAKKKEKGERASMQPGRDYKQHQRGKKESGLDREEHFAK